MNRPYFTADDIPRRAEDEQRDIESEAREVCGPDWLITPNVRFGGRSPMEVIKADQGFWVRDVVRSIKHGDIS
jgi:uncharacterized protein (DUF2384 family)